MKTAPQVFTLTNLWFSNKDGFLWDRQLLLTRGFRENFCTVFKSQTPVNAHRQSHIQCTNVYLCVWLYYQRRKCTCIACTCIKHSSSHCINLFLFHCQFRTRFILVEGCVPPHELARPPRRMKKCDKKNLLWKCCVRARVGKIVFISWRPLTWSMNYRWFRAETPPKYENILLGKHERRNQSSDGKWIPGLSVICTSRNLRRGEGAFYL